MPRSIQHVQSLCRFGVALEEITPPVGIYHRMWGAAEHDRSTGVHRPLTATAAVFQSLQTTSPSVDSEQVLIALDHCLLGSAEMQFLLDRVSGQAGIARESLLVVFSHTHAAGLMSFEREALPGGELIRDYLTEVSSVVAELVTAAREKSQPATIAYGVGRCTLAADRDFWDKQSQQFVCGYNPEESADDTVLVAQITDAKGQLLASIVNYACHPTTLAWQNTLISPDYPGAMRDVVEQATGAPCVFIQGASGDLGPMEGFVGDVEVADRHGRQLGYAALSALCEVAPPNLRFEYSGPVVSGATIGTWSWTPLSAGEAAHQSRWQTMRWTIALPYRVGIGDVHRARVDLQRTAAELEAAQAAGDEIRRRDLRALVERQVRRLNRLQSLPAGENYPYPVWLWRIGNAFWLGVEGEPYSLLQRSLRARFPDTPLVVASLANGSRISYLPPTDAYDTGRYQETIALLAPGCLEHVIDEVANQIESWLADEAD